MGIDKPSPKNLLYFPAQLTVASSALDFQAFLDLPSSRN
jgi:hypothetical protein